MGRTGETKKKILHSLMDGPKTTTLLSKELAIAPSTTSQHLKELSILGLVEIGFDEHFKNVKYYGTAGTFSNRVTSQLATY